MIAKTLYDKLWDAHVVRVEEDGASLLYIDRQLIHEVTSPQAFEGLRLANRVPWRVQANFAVPDHNVPTTICNSVEEIPDPISRLQVETLDKNCQDNGIKEFAMNDPKQGIVHVIGPELGITLPGITIVCGDSHTSTHGALGALAFGIGTSEVEHVLATQCLIQKKSKNMLISVDGEIEQGVTAKDIILYIIGQIGTAGGTGYAIEFGGTAIQALSIEGRMTVCNMAIEAGARAGFVAVDDKTIEYIRKHNLLISKDNLAIAEKNWLELKTDNNAQFDQVIHIKIKDIKPQITWGTSPEMVISVDSKIPNPGDITDSTKAEAIVRALNYMGLEANKLISEIQLDKIFIGSCTNGRIEDLRTAAKVVQGRKVASTIKQALVVPGSGSVKRQAEQEGLDKIFIEAGFEWRLPGCSMCLAMNADRLEAGERCASTSNRNFEGRQGKDGRTHLVSPEMAAAAAITGHFTDIRQFIN